MAPAGPSAYDAVPYPPRPAAATHPSRLAAVAHLHGLEPATPHRCRYLDLGCGDGVNVLSAAASLPDAAFVGIDASAGAIDRGAALAAAAGLDNVRLSVGDLRDAPGIEPAAHDYVVLHGLLSWVPEEVREAALAHAARALAPGGVLLASYNALPGWYMRWPARGLTRELAKQESGDARAATGAAIEALRLARELHGAHDAYAAALDETIDRYQNAVPEVLYHDDLAEICEPLGAEEVAELAGRHGLRYVGEAFASHWWEHRLPPYSAKRLRHHAGDTALARQRLADHSSGVPFKATLFAPAAAVEGEPGIDPARALDLHLSPTDAEAPAEQPKALAALAGALGTRAPGPVEGRELAGLAGLSDETAALALLRLAAEGTAALWLDPPRFASEPGPRPVASALVRAQVATGGSVSSLRHEALDFEEPLGRFMLSLLDGTRDREAVAGQLTVRARELGNANAEITAEQVDGMLGELARRALLVA